MATGAGYGGDHFDFGGAEFSGSFTAKAEYYERGAAPTALNALPARAAGFTGRGDEMGELLRAFDPAVSGGEGGAVPVLVAALSGLGGIGKTSLAVEAAHEACGRGWFPGGVLFLDLHGYDDDPVTGEQALEALLRALGVEPEHIPVRGDARGSLYRSVLAERGREQGSVLVLVDNASSPDQVRPLLPGDVRHRVLVTSRDRLPQLGARLVPLNQLAPEEAYELLDHALRIADPDDARVVDAPGATEELARLCGHLPLALQIVAALLAEDEGMTVAELVAELRESRDLLDHLNDGERNVRAAFELSYRRLPPEQARLLRLLALAPGPETSDEVVAALVGAEAPPMRELKALARAHLVERGSGRGWWRLHDLVRVFGVGLVAGDAVLRGEGAAARERVLGVYLRRAKAADQRLRWVPGRPEPEGFTDWSEALAWLDAERAGLVAAAQWAGEEQLANTVRELPRCLWWYLEWRRFFEDWITVATAAWEAARRAGDRLVEARAWDDLGFALRKTGSAALAIDAHIGARDLFREVGDTRGEARAWDHLGVALQEMGRPTEAIDAHTRARDYFGSVGLPVAEASACSRLGAALQEAGRAVEAIGVHVRACDLYEAAGDGHGLAIAFNNLGLSLRAAGRAGDAIDAYNRALATFERVKDWYRVGRTLHNLAHVHKDAGRSAEARSHYLKAADAYILGNAPSHAARCREIADTLTP